MPDTGVIVTLDTIYQTMLELRDEVRGMRPLVTQGEDHEERIRALERRTGRWVGALAFLAVAVPSVIGYLLP